MLVRFLFLVFFFFVSLSASAALTTGPIQPQAALAFKPSILDTAGISRLSMPVAVNGATGLATIKTGFVTARMLAMRASGGPIGLAATAAIAAASLCYADDKWSDCTIRQIMPVDIDTSTITAATSQTVYKYSADLNYNTACPISYGSASTISESSAQACNGMSTILSDSCNFDSANYYYVQQSPGSCIYLMYNKSTNQSTGSPASISSVFYWFGTEYSCPSGSILTDSNGGPSSVGHYCTPESAYSCLTDYARSDSSGNLDASGMFCSYQKPSLTAEQRQDILAPYLLGYYANQLFADADGKLDTGYFSDPDTTFDTAVTPDGMPMTYTQLNQYVTWIRDGSAQTTDPMSPHYMSPTEYSYAFNYVNNSDITNNNLNNSAYVTPAQAAQNAASSAVGLTQTQYETSTKNMDTASATAIKATNTDAVDNPDDGGFNDANDQLTNISNGDIADLPTLATPNLPGHSSCQTIDISWKQYQAVFPTTSQCAKMEEFKSMLGYILYLLTAIGLIFELLRRVE